MSRTTRALSVVLAGALVAGVLVAFTPGEGRQAKATLGPLQAVTVSAADFHPSRDTWTFANGGFQLRGDGNHLARIPFPAETVLLTSVKIRVFDDLNTGNLCVTLYRARPGDATEDNWGQRCTSGQSGAEPQTLSLPVFGRVGGFHSAYLWITFDEHASNLRLYGATVFYRVVT